MVFATVTLSDHKPGALPEATPDPRKRMPPVSLRGRRRSPGRALCERGRRGRSSTAPYAGGEHVDLPLFCLLIEAFQKNGVHMAVSGHHLLTRLLAPGGHVAVSASTSARQCAELRHTGPGTSTLRQGSTRSKQVPKVSPPAPRSPAGGSPPGPDPLALGGQPGRAPLGAYGGAHPGADAVQRGRRRPAPAARGPALPPVATARTWLMAWPSRGPGGPPRLAQRASSSATAPVSATGATPARPAGGRVWGPSLAARAQSPAAASTRCIDGWTGRASPAGAAEAFGSLPGAGTARGRFVDFGTQLIRSPRYSNLQRLRSHTSPCASVEARWSRCHISRFFLVTWSKCTGAGGIRLARRNTLGTPFVLRTLR